MVSGMAESFQQAEESLSLADVRGNLATQCIGGFEFHFVAEPLQEIQPRGCGGSRNRSTQHECLDGKARFLECGAKADIGDAVHKGPAVERDASDINAELWEQFVFRLQ